MSCCDHAFVLYAIISIYLGKTKKLFVTFVDYEKTFDGIDHSLLWKKLGHYDINGKVLSGMKNLYRKTKACVDVDGSLRDVFECRVGVRQGDNHNHLPLLFIIFMNDFLEYVTSKFTGVSLDYDGIDMQVF